MKPNKVMIETFPFGPKDQFHQVMIHQRVAVSYVASFAMDLMRTGMCAGVPNKKGDGFERLFTPTEVVQRATEIASLAFSELERRGWVVESPALKPLENGNKVGF